MERNVKNVANSLSFFFAEKLKKINKNKVRIFFASVLTKKKEMQKMKIPYYDQNLLLITQILSSCEIF